MAPDKNLAAAGRAREGDGAGPPKDDEGRYIIGDPGQGCRHCGAVKVSEQAGAVVYRSASGCCPDSVRDLIAKKEREYAMYRNLLQIAQTPGNQKKAQELQDELEDLRKHLNVLEGS